MERKLSRREILAGMVGAAVAVGVAGIVRGNRAVAQAKKEFTITLRPKSGIPDIPDVTLADPATDEEAYEAQRRGRHFNIQAYYLASSPGCWYVYIPGRGWLKAC